MQFSDVIGQEDIIRQLVSQVDNGRLPHALMLCGPQGSGKLAIVLALARYMLCEGKDAAPEASLFGDAEPALTETSQEGAVKEPCGHCRACQMTAQWAHPDLHFSFPLIKGKSTDQPVSDDRLTEWREQISTTPYFTANDWLADLHAENQQLQFYVGESDALQRKLSLKSSQGGYRVVIIWLPEKMPPAVANKLLKLIEEPPAKTHFLMVSQEPDQVLGTIVSRTQRIVVPRLSEEVIAQALVSQQHLSEPLARNLAHIAQGSYTQALKLTEEDSDRREYFDLFVQLMRLCYMRKIKDLRQWTEQVSALGRERQKHMLEYCQRLIRENFIYNFRQGVVGQTSEEPNPEVAKLNYMTDEEVQFAQNFARFINERNVIPIMDELTHCQTDIEQNVSAKMVFFDLAVKIIVLLKQ